MARFYGELAGQAREKVTRLGSKKSGLWAHLSGWNIGVVVDCQCIDGKDVIRVYRTGGSNNPIIGELLAEVSDNA